MSQTLRFTQTIMKYIQLFHFNPETLPEKKNQIVSSTSDKNRISTLKKNRQLRKSLVMQNKVEQGF
jgi:hypothetical protein